MKDLREASYASDGSYPVRMSHSSITFYADTVGDSTIERVTYSISGGVLYRAMISPAGDPLSYTGQPTATTTIARSVINNASTPVFRYFDDTGTSSVHR